MRKEIDGLIQNYESWLEKTILGRKHAEETVRLADIYSDSHCKVISCLSCKATTLYTCRTQWYVKITTACGFLPFGISKEHCCVVQQNAMEQSDRAPLSMTLGGVESIL